MTRRREDVNTRHLIPDDHAVVELVQQAGDLLGLIAEAEDESASDASDVEPWDLPAPFAARAAEQALNRIATVAIAQLSPPWVDETKSPRWYAPDGRYEHAPLRLIIVDLADVDTLVAAFQVAHRALEGGLDQENPDHRRLGDLRELLDIIEPSGPWQDNADRPIDTGAKLEPLARLVRLLNIAPDEDTHALAAVARAAEAHQDVVLTGPQERAYQHLADRFNQLLTSGDPLHRWLF